MGPADKTRRLASGSHSEFGTALSIRWFRPDAMSSARGGSRQSMNWDAVGAEKPLACVTRSIPLVGGTRLPPTNGSLDGHSCAR